MVKAKVVVKDPQGLHLRPATVLCTEARKYKSSVNIEFGSNMGNAKSVLSLLGAGIKCGSEVIFICEGEDEQEALDAVVSLVENGSCEKS